MGALRVKGEFLCATNVSLHKRYKSVTTTELKMKLIGRMDHLAKTRNLAETKLEDSDSLNLEKIPAEE